MGSGAGVSGNGRVCVCPSSTAGYQTHSLSGLGSTFIISVSVEWESDRGSAGFSAGVSQGSSQGGSWAAFSSGGSTEEESASELLLTAGRIPFCTAVGLSGGPWFLTG